ncbi:hypothetical protein HDC35_000896 [Sphingopyxis sp. JAI128]|nr:hypothetical protein [Sphingopyxis sp. JAI128]
MIRGGGGAGYYPMHLILRFWPKDANTPSKVGEEPS